MLNRKRAVQYKVLVVVIVIVVMLKRHIDEAETEGVFVIVIIFCIFFVEKVRDEIIEARSKRRHMAFVKFFIAIVYLLMS